MNTIHSQLLSHEMPNIHNIAKGIGDINLAYQCFRLALVSDNDHGESYNNLGVLEYRRGNLETARAFFMTAANLSPHMFQPHYNHAKLAHKVSATLPNITAISRTQ
ncbi:Tetratricopeptide repeat protein 8 [Portunus trituberculatus]|uniref:Tetratricopeptide repeat protein 8 n=1 Tax=Portunus trituberculatus TaxID=210409 RepID=A0A5B7IHS7_PORTR|nr:Tetratricopeptide repeat protein 8 [Portunus trituberculatus]